MVLTDLDRLAVPDGPCAAEREAAGELDADNDVYGSPEQPMQVARELVRDSFSAASGKLILHYWRGDWWTYSGAAWDKVGDELEVREPIWSRLENVCYKTVKIDDTGEPITKPWGPTTSKVNNLMEPLQIQVRLPSDREAPMWTTATNAPRPDPRDLIAMSNGLFDMSSRILLPHDADLFTTWSLAFDYEENATCPTWDGFLSDIFEHDPNGALALQEMTGYIISGRLDLHKALMLLGPARGGKGTISRTIKQLVGVDNTVSPSLHTLGADFGLEGLIGKPLAVLEDARADEAHRTGTIAVERLLNIIGEDDVSVNRKGISYWHGKLPTRFVLVSNEMPRFLDPSGAITTRFVMVRLRKSYTENPDHTLGSRINLELPGIFNWALDGLDRLNAQDGKFTRPDSMDEMLDLMHDLASPVAKFLDESYVITGHADDYLPVSDVHRAYKAWCEDAGLKPANRDTFTQRVTAADPQITFKNTRVNGSSKQRLLFGLKPRNSWVTNPSPR